MVNMRELFATPGSRVAYRFPGKVEGGIEDDVPAVTAGDDDEGSAAEGAVAAFPGITITTSSSPMPVSLIKDASVRIRPLKIQRCCIPFDS
jgi:hypothetical protein